MTYSGYGSLQQDLLQTDSPLRQNPVDLLVCSLMLEELDPAFGLPQWSAERVQGELHTLFRVMEDSEIPVIALNTFLLPYYSETGIATTKDIPDTTNEVQILNSFVHSWVQDHSPRFCLIDWNRIVRRIGEAEASDYRYWYLKKSPFKRSFLDQMAIELRTIVRSLKGLTKKCLVLDCDNTLWGGIIGEDGLNGIHLDGHEYPGRIFYDFQKTVLQLAERGILVVLCSKNNQQDVFEVFDEHPWCLLNRSHLSAYRINWNDKATNLSSLAEELNLGLDCFVFVDDNPRELALVNQLLPDITVLQVPEKLYEFPTLLLRNGWFDRLSSAPEDRLRAQLYQAESLRKTEKDQHADLESYLASLNQTAIIHIASESEILRVAQLTQKTNQFNLTTRRYSEYEIQQFCASDKSCVYTLTADDRFGSLGLIGVLIAKRENDSAVVDTLLMSCRALGRQLEIKFVIECLGDISDTWEISRWEAEYIPTTKNIQVKSFWKKIGFTLMNGENGASRFELLASRPKLAAPHYIKVDKR
jgi:FkbH-like protein